MMGNGNFTAISTESVFQANLARVVLVKKIPKGLKTVNRKGRFVSRATQV